MTTLTISNVAAELAVPDGSMSVVIHDTSTIIVNTPPAAVYMGSLQIAGSYTRPIASGLRGVVASVVDAASGGQIAAGRFNLPPAGSTEAQVHDATATAAALSVSAPHNRIAKLVAPILSGSGRFCEPLTSTHYSSPTFLSQVSLPLQGLISGGAAGQLTFTARVTPASIPPLVVTAGVAGGVVVRRELRTMPRADQERFARAVIRMMENEAGRPRSSEFFRLAAYHGWPERVLCAHDSELFPGWHRGYLCAFEQALQRADRALGGDGQLGLPYWDFTVTRINGEVMPAILRQVFHRDPLLYPRQLLGDDSGGASHFFRVGYSQIESDVYIARVCIR